MSDGIKRSRSDAPSTPSKRRAFFDVVKNCCITHFDVLRYSCKWTITNFSLRKEKPGEYLTSSTFLAGASDELKWQLTLFPKGSSISSLDCVSIFLKLLSSERKSVSVKFSFFIINAAREKTNAMVAEKVFTMNIDYGFSKYIKRSALFDADKDLLPENKLTITCELLITTDSINMTQRNVHVPKCQLLDELGGLLNNERFADVTLAVDGQLIQAHKLILAARSPVFAAMFEHEMEERKRNRVDITDVDHEVLLEMLGYIYTGRAPNLNKMADKLLRAADKYALDRLKAMCEEALCLSLSVETAADILILADLHSADQLKAQTIDFINTNPADVMDTVGWSNVISSHPQLVAETFRSLASELSTLKVKSD